MPGARVRVPRDPDRPARERGRRDRPRDARVRRRRDRDRSTGPPRHDQPEEWRHREPVHQRVRRRCRCALSARGRRRCTDRKRAGRLRLGRSALPGASHLRGARPRGSPLALPPVPARGAAVATRPMTKNIPLLYGFSFFDQFMIVIASWVPYLATQGIGMRQFMELRAVFAIVILSGEVPSGLLSDLWGRKKALLLGSTVKAVSFSLLPLWSSYEGFLFYHLTMGIALSMISGGDVALLWDSYLAEDDEKSRGAAVVRQGELASGTGGTVSALVGGAGVTLSYWTLPGGQPL